jgi:hypothetical protein
MITTGVLVQKLSNYNILVVSVGSRAALLFNPVLIPASQIFEQGQTNEGKLVVLDAIEQLKATISWSWVGEGGNVCLHLLLSLGAV